MPQRCEHHADVAEVLLPVTAAEDQDVVHVHCNKPPHHARGDAVLDPHGVAIVVKDQAGAGENVVHVAHEERGHAVQAKSAHSKLKLTTRDAEGRLMDVLLAHPELVIGGGEV